jgi:hypothetical protein
MEQPDLMMGHMRNEDTDRILPRGVKTTDAKWPLKGLERNNQHYREGSLGFLLFVQLL